MEKNKIMILDGSMEQQKEIIENFLSSLTPEEHEMAMSDEFAYLDDES